MRSRAHGESDPRTTTLCLSPITACVRRGLTAIHRIRGRERQKWREVDAKSLVCVRYEPRARRCLSAAVYSDSEPLMAAAARIECAPCVCLIPRRQHSPAPAKPAVDSEAAARRHHGVTQQTRESSIGELVDVANVARDINSIEASFPRALSRVRCVRPNNHISLTNHTCLACRHAPNTLSFKKIETFGGHTGVRYTLAFRVCAIWELLERRRALSGSAFGMRGASLCALMRATFME